MFETNDDAEVVIEPSKSTFQREAQRLDCLHPWRRLRVTNRSIRAVDDPLTVKDLKKYEKQHDLPGTSEHAHARTVSSLQTIVHDKTSTQQYQTQQP